MAEGRIFISYRRGLDNGEARSLYYQLERYFDRDRLFMDVDDIPAGIDFVEYLDDQVAQCNALIAVIGRGWIADTKRLHSEEDFVRIEIEAALARTTQIPIIPLIIDDCQMPSKDDLPDSLHRLRRRAGVPISHDSYASTIDARLIPALSNALGEQAPPERSVAKPVTLHAPSVAPQTSAETDTDKLRDVDEPWCPEMVVIPAGKFMMGITTEEIKAFGIDKHTAALAQPRHEVEITEPFKLARYATTFEEYDVYCQEAGIDPPGDEGWGRGRRPVVNVSWNDMTAYCDWLTEKTGQLYRKPSEAEWEYACRAGTETAFSFGDDISSDPANYDKERGKTVPVDFPGFRPNAFGLYQMHGNVWEWCADRFADSYETPRRQTPHSIADGTARVVRGGSWSDYPLILRSADRGRDGPDDGGYDLGFRPARTLLTP